MSDLDKKLEEILNDTYSAGAQDPELEMYGENSDETEAIKQAFIDDGWVSPEKKLQVMKNVDKTVEIPPFIGKH